MLREGRSWDTLWRPCRILTKRHSTSTQNSLQATRHPREFPGRPRPKGKCSRSPGHTQCHLEAEAGNPLSPLPPTEIPAVVPPTPTLTAWPLQAPSLLSHSPWRVRPEMRIKHPPFLHPFPAHPLTPLFSAAAEPGTPSAPVRGRTGDRSFLGELGLRAVPSPPSGLRLVISWVNYIQAISDWHKPTHPQSLPRRRAGPAQGQDARAPATLGGVLTLAMATWGGGLSSQFQDLLPSPAPRPPSQHFLPHPPFCLSPHKSLSCPSSSRFGMKSRGSEFRRRPLHKHSDWG